MGQRVEDILEEALSLPDESRALLAEALLESLEIGEDFEVSEAWRREIRERCREVDAGHVDLIPGDEAMARLRARFS